MPFEPRLDRAVLYACAVSLDFRVSRLPADPFQIARNAGLTIVPLSAAVQHPGWFPEDLPGRMQMQSILTLTSPSFCIVWRDDTLRPERLRFMLCHELAHLFMNHYRDFPEVMFSGRRHESGLEAEADAFARNLLAPVPVVDVIRYNRPSLARAELFGMTRSAWIRRLDHLAADRAFVSEETADTLIRLYHDFLLGRRCAACGHVFTDTAQEDRCPRCGAAGPEWCLQPDPPAK